MSQYPKYIGSVLVLFSLMDRINKDLEIVKSSTWVTVSLTTKSMEGLPAKIARESRCTQTGEELKENQWLC